MNNYDRTLLDKHQYNLIQNNLKQCFDEFKPRSEFIRKNPLVETHNRTSLDANESPNLISFKSQKSLKTLETVASFESIFSSTEVYSLIKSKFDSIENYITTKIISAENTFITFSTNITGAKLGVKHLHSLLNGDHCNVWSFAIPLYINDSVDEWANFWYNSSENLYPIRYYVDYERVKRLQIQYTSFRLPKDGSVFSILFDGARTPHYIDYTSHLYAFLVYDGVTLKDNMVLNKRIITELL